jgi:hypothetical protein
MLHHMIADRMADTREKRPFQVGCDDVHLEDGTKGVCRTTS